MILYTNKRKTILIFLLCLFTFVFTSCSLFENKTEKNDEYEFALNVFVEGNDSFYLKEKITEEWKLYCKENESKKYIDNFTIDYSSVNINKIGNYKITFYFEENNKKMYTIKYIDIIENPVVGIDVDGKFEFEKGNFETLSWKYYLILKSGKKEELNTSFSTDVSSVNINEAGTYQVTFTYKDNETIHLLTKDIVIKDDGGQENDEKTNYKLSFVSGKKQFNQNDEIIMDDWIFEIIDINTNEKVKNINFNKDTFQVKPIDSSCFGEINVEIIYEFDTGSELLFLKDYILIEILEVLEYVTVKLNIEGESYKEITVAKNKVLNLEEYFPLYNDENLYLTELYYALYDENNELSSMYEIENRNFIIPDNVVITAYYYEPIIENIKVTGTTEFILNKNDFSTDDWIVYALYNDGKKKEIEFEFDDTNVDKTKTGDYVVKIKADVYEKDYNISIFKEETKDTYYTYELTEENYEYVEDYENFNSTVLFEETQDMINARKQDEKQYVKVDGLYTFEFKYSLSPQFYFLKTYNDADGYRYWAIPVASITYADYENLIQMTPANYSSANNAKTADTFLENGVVTALELNLTEYSNHKIETKKLLENKKAIPFSIQVTVGSLPKYTCIVTKSVGFFTFVDEVSSPKETFFKNKNNTEIYLYYGNVNANIKTKEKDFYNNIHESSFKELAYVNKFCFVYSKDMTLPNNSTIDDEIENCSIISIENLNKLSAYKYNYISLKRIVNVNEYNFGIGYIYNEEILEDRYFGNTIIVYIERETYLIK